MLGNHFGDKANAETPQERVWCTPFTPSKTLPEGKDIWLVNRAGGQFPAFGDYAAISSSASDTAPAFMVGVPLARLTQNGQMTQDGLRYCTIYGVQKDVESLAKFTTTCTPKSLKYEGTAGIRTHSPA